MHYNFVGFTHDMGFRVFEFEGVGEDRVRTGYRVRADLALIHRYGIRVQDLPLLCRGILERRNEDDGRRNLTYTEADMRLTAELAASRVLDAQRKRAPRKPPSPHSGLGWRGPHV